jgi:hypothetical protein
VIPPRLNRPRRAGGRADGPDAADVVYRSRAGLADVGERALITTGYNHAVATIRKNITPLGFSACSLADNEVTGTDVNYRSVWARDGCHHHCRNR